MAITEWRKGSNSISKHDITGRVLFMQSMSDQPVSVSVLIQNIDEIEEFLENDIIGHRKTKKMGAHNKYFEDISKISESIFASFKGFY